MSDFEIQSELNAIVTKLEDIRSSIDSGAAGLIQVSLDYSTMIEFRNMLESCSMQLQKLNTLMYAMFYRLVHPRNNKLADELDKIVEQELLQFYGFPQEEDK